MLKRPNPFLFVCLLAGAFYSCKKSPEQAAVTDTTQVDSVHARMEPVSTASTAPYQPQRIAIADFTGDEPTIDLFRKIYPEDSLFLLTEDVTSADVRITAWEY